LFKPINGHLRIHATDLQTSVIANIQVGEYEGSDSFAVDAELINDIVTNLPEDEANFEYDNGKLIVKSGKAKYSIPTIQDTDRFPIIELDESGIQFQYRYIESLVRNDQQSQLLCLDGKCNEGTKWCVL